MRSPSEADAVLRRLREACGGGDSGAALALLRQASPAELIRLDERARAVPYYSVGPLGSAADGDAVLRQGEVLAECVASLHPNGFLREQAVRLLVLREGELVARCLALRAVDHVGPVRRIALAGLMSRPDVSALGVLLRVRHRQPGAAALTAYRQLFEATKLLASADLVVRRHAYDEVLERMDSGAVAACLSTETDQWSRRRLVERWMATDPARAKAQLLTSRYVEGRLAVLLNGSDELFDRAELEDRMLDRSRRVRAAACWRYRRAGHAPASFYRARWEADGVERALEGLGETGQRLSEAEARTELASTEPRRRLSALRLWPTDQPPKRLLLDLLSDPSGAVVKAAARLLVRGPGVRYDDVVAIAASEQANQRRAAWRLRRELGGWSRLRADLHAVQDRDEKLARAARDDLANWLTYTAANVHQPLLPSERDDIHAQLDQVDLAPHVVAELKFHAGIR